MNDRPTIGERYSSATESSDLRVRTESRGDVDTLIAAGWIPDGFATSLYRLRTEFDAVKGEHELAEANLQQQLDTARLAQNVIDPKVLQRFRGEGLSADEATSVARKVAAEQGDAIRKQARTDALTARLFVLAHLKTLTKAKDQLGAFALGLAYGRQCTLNPDQVLALAGKVLEAFLDPNCPRCTGRKINGGSHRGEPETVCRPCKGTGKRLQEIGHNNEQRAFAARLIMQLDFMFSDVDRLLRNYLRSGSA